MNVVKKNTSNNKKRPERCKLKFIDSFRFMSSKLENLVANLVETHKKLSINILKQRFFNTYRLCDDNIDKFKLLLRKGFIHMNTWTRGKNLKNLYL